MKKDMDKMKKLVFLVWTISLFSFLIACTAIKETQKPEKVSEGIQTRFKEEVEKELIILNKTNPILAEELKRLPELRTGLNEKGVVTINRIVTFYTQSPNPDEVKQTFDKILSIGKKECRKFSAPLQALFWLAEEKELPLSENPLKKYSQEKYRGFNNKLGEDEEVVMFVYNIWKNTYETSKWKDPNEIIDRLNSPHLFDLFFRDNIAYDFDKKTIIMSERNYYQNWGSYLESAKVTIKKRKGICNDAANLAYEILTKAGYNVKPLQVRFMFPAAIGNFKPSNRHFVAILEEDELFYKIADDVYVKEGIIGPFKSIKEIGDIVAKNHNTRMKEYSLSQVPIQ